MKVKYPTKLEFVAEELPNKNWKLSYKEHFKPEDFDAFKLAKNLFDSAGVGVILDKDNSCAKIEIISSRGQIFDYVCGEFLTLSNLAQRTLQELYIYAGINIALKTTSGYEGIINK